MSKNCWVSKSPSFGLFTLNHLLRAGLRRCARGGDEASSLAPSRCLKPKPKRRGKDEFLGVVLEKLIPRHSMGLAVFHLHWGWLETSRGQCMSRSIQSRGVFGIVSLR